MIAIILSCFLASFSLCFFLLAACWLVTSVKDSLGARRPRILIALAKTREWVCLFILVMGVMGFAMALVVTGDLDFAVRGAFEFIFWGLRVIPVAAALRFCYDCWCAYAKRAAVPMVMLPCCAALRKNGNKGGTDQHSLR
jgi:hypothetical protein